MDIIKAIADEFPHTDIIHLNHAGVGRWPMRTVRAIHNFAKENAQYGAILSADWTQHATTLRTMLADLINAESKDEIALLKNTSEALSCIAYGIDWQTKDNIVVGKQEFPSNRIVWESLQNTHAIEVRIVDLYAAASPEQALIDASDEHTRLIAASSIQYATGYRMDLNYLGKHCHNADILFCVDAIQSIGAAAVDVRSSFIDFLAADAHKWLLAPEGIALFYCKNLHILKLKLNQYGWNMMDDCNNYDALYSESDILKWQPKANAMRFECGSLNHLGVYALHASLALLMEIGAGEIYKKIALNVDYLAENLDQDRFEPLTPDDKARRGGIFTFKALRQDTKALFKHLMENKVFCAYRGGGIRLSPHFYNTAEDFDTALELLHGNG